MKYLKTYDNFEPIKHNLAKPFKVKKNIDTSINHLNTRIKSLRKRLGNQKFGYGKLRRKRTEMNTDKNQKIQKLKDLSFKKIKQTTYLIEHPLKENAENPKNLLEVLEFPDFKPEDIEKYIGLDKKDYKIEEDYYHNPTYDENQLTLLIKPKKLENLMDIDDYNGGIIEYLLRLDSSYRDYKYDIQDDELNYLQNYLADDVLNKIKELGKLFDYKIKPRKEGKIHEFFDYLGLKSELEDFKNEMRYEHERAIEKTAGVILKSIPFNICYSRDSDFNLELNFQYEEMKNYIKENKLFKVTTIKEFLENISESSDFNYEFEYEHYDELGDFKDLKSSVEDAVDKYLDSPDDIFVNLIEVDNLELFKKKVDLAYFDYVYDRWVKNKRVSMNLFQLAKEYNNSIVTWLKSKEFENIIYKRSKDEIDNYEEFVFGEDVRAFNL